MSHWELLQKARVHIAAKEWAAAQAAWQQLTEWIAPHIYVPPTFADVSTGRDAALEAARAAMIES
jgi:hypothetical protein